MGLIQSQRWCLHCEDYTLHGRSHFSFGLGCLLTLLTGCLFLPAWILISLAYAAFAPWLCQTCGTSGNPSDAPDDDPSPLILPSRTDGDPGAVRRPWTWPEALRPAAIAGVLRGCWASLARTYRGLPDWAQPIVWGLGIASPILSAMFALRWLLR